ncbi:MAG: VWA domain-containing protein [Sandaracinus sp.]|nr:VWA domain-containing protein [Sandaracinus sp.]
MTFVAPLFLLVLALAVPVIVAFLVKRRRQMVVVPSILRWQALAIAKHRSRRFKNLARLVALLACVAAVLALGMAAARPRLLGDGALTVVVVDVSPSMGTLEHGPLSDAADRLRDLAASMGPRDRVAVFAAGEAPRRLLAPTNDPARVRESASLLVPEAHAMLEPTLALARALADDAGNARVVLLHDGGSHVAMGGIREERFGADRRANVGLTLFAARPAPNASSDDERDVLVSVAAAGDATRRVRVRLRAGDVDLGHRDLDVPAGEEADARFRLRLPLTHLSAELTPLDGLGDDLPSDDRAELALSAVSAPPVRWMAAPLEGDEPHATRRHFAEHALRAAGVTELEALEGDAPDESVVVSFGAPARRVQRPMLILGGVEPPPDTSQRIAAPRAFWPEGVRGLGALEGAATTLHRVDDDHPLLRGVELDGTTIVRAHAIDPGDGIPLVELDGNVDESGTRTGGVVVAAGGEGPGRWVYVGLDPEGSDVVLRVAYPLLVSSALAWLSGSSRTELAPTPTRAEVALEVDETSHPRFEAPGFGLPPLPWILAALAALLLAAEGLAYARRVVS